jgi:putative glycoprotein polyprotein
VLVIILSSVVVLVGGFIALLVFTFSGPRSVWYKDKTHVITEGYALSKYSFFVCDRGGIVDKVKYKGFTADSPVIPDSAEWKFYDQWGVLMAWSDNKLDKARGMKAYSLFVIDSLLYNRHQKEILNLRKSYLAKEQNYILKGFLSYGGGSVPAYIFRYNTKTRIITVSEWDGYYLEGNRIKLSKEANDSVITLIRQHPEARVRDGEHRDRYGKGKMCSSLEVNNRTIFDCVGSDFSHMPTPFRNIMRLFASKDVQGRDILFSLDKSR